LFVRTVIRRMRKKDHDKVCSLFLLLFSLDLLFAELPGDHRSSSNRRLAAKGRKKQRGRSIKKLDVLVILLGDGPRESREIGSRTLRVQDKGKRVMLERLKSLGNDNEIAPHYVGPLMCSHPYGPPEDKLAVSAFCTSISNKKQFLRQHFRCNAMTM
jgi:hypothetical protein